MAVWDGGLIPRVLISAKSTHVDRFYLLFGAEINGLWVGCSITRVSISVPLRFCEAGFGYFLSRKESNKTLIRVNLPEHSEACFINAQPSSPGCVCL
jgi:hypothetical protein